MKVPTCCSSDCRPLPHDHPWDPLPTVCLFGPGRQFTSIFKSKFRRMDRITLKSPIVKSRLLERHINRLLLHASTFGDLDVARHPLDVGVGASAADDDGPTPLRAAAQNGYEALARLLVGAWRRRLGGRLLCIDATAPSGGGRRHGAGTAARGTWRPRLWPTTTGCRRCA